MAILIDSEFENFLVSSSFHWNSLRLVFVLLSSSITEHAEEHAEKRMYSYEAELFDNPHSLGSSLWRNSMSRSATSVSNHSSMQWSTSVFSEENTLSPSPDDETQFDPLSTYVSNDIICHEICFSISKLKRTFLACTDADLRDIKDALQNHRDLQY